jgi:hypothetical protein
MLPFPTAQEAEEFIKYTLSRKCGRIYPCITPRFIPTCTMELMQGGWLGGCWGRDHGCLVCTEDGALKATWQHRQGLCSQVQVQRQLQAACWQMQVFPPLRFWTCIGYCRAG